MGDEDDAGKGMLLLPRLLVGVIKPVEVWWCQSGGELPIPFPSGKGLTSSLSSIDLTFNMPNISSGLDDGGIG